MDKFETLPQAAERTGMPLEALSAIVKRKLIKHYKLGQGIYLIAPDSLDEYVKGGFVPARENKPRGRKKDSSEVVVTETTSESSLTVVAGTPPAPVHTPEPAVEV